MTSLSVGHVMVEPHIHTVRQMWRLRGLRELSRLYALLSFFLMAFQKITGPKTNFLSCYFVFLDQTEWRTMKQITKTAIMKINSSKLCLPLFAFWNICLQCFFPFTMSMSDQCFACHVDNLIIWKLTNCNFFFFTAVVIKYVSSGILKLYELKKSF